MPKEVDPKNTTRAAAYALWMKAPNPMVTFFKTFDVTNLIKVSRKRSLKFNMLLDYCIGRAAVKVKEFYILPVGEKLMQYDTIAVNTIVKNKEGEVSSCDLSYNAELNQFNEEYLKYTTQVAASCQDRDLSENSMVIGTSAIIDTEIDGAVGMNSGIFNNPFIIWGRYKKKWFRYYLPLSFQFHHTQMDGAHAGVFLKNLQNEINLLKLWLKERSTLMEELEAIMQKFAASGWDLIAVPAQEWLDGKADKDTLVSAIKQADKECGSCGCELDPLYKRVMELL